MDRLVIELTGDLPDERKYAILAKADALANDLAGTLRDDCGVDLNVSVKSVRPGKKAAAGLQGQQAAPGTVAIMNKAAE